MLRPNGQLTSSLGTRNPWLMKDSAFFPFSDPDATSALNRSPADMWTRLNCTDACDQLPRCQPDMQHVQEATAPTQTFKVFHMLGLSGG